MLNLASDRARAKSALGRGLKSENFAEAKKGSRMRLFMEQMEEEERRMNEEDPGAEYQFGSSTSWHEVIKKDCEEKMRKWRQEKLERGEELEEDDEDEEGVEGDEEGGSSTGTEGSGEDTKMETKTEIS